MNTCVRCGTQFAVGEDRCPFCSLPVADDADVTRAASDPSSGQGPWQQSSGQGPWQQSSGQGPWQQPGPQGPPPGQQGAPGRPWQGSPPGQGGPYQGPLGQPGQPWQGQQPMAGGPPGGGWQGPPGGGPPWQGGGVPPKKGMNPGLLVAIGLAVLLVLGLGAWGLVAAFSGDDDTTAGGGGDETSESASPSEAPTPSPTEESSDTESAEPTPTEGPTEDGGGSGGGSDVVDFDLSTTDEAVITVTVSSPGRLTIEAQSDIEQDIVMVVNDPEGAEVCNEDSLITFPEECTFQAEVGEYEVLVSPYDDADRGGPGEVRIS